MASPPVDNPYAAPLVPSAEIGTSTEERPKRNAFIWFGFGYWFAYSALMVIAQTATIASGDDPGDGQEVIVVLFGLPIMTAMFAGIYALWWWIRTRTLDLRPRRLYHILSGVSSVVFVIGVLGGLMALPDLLELFIEILIPATIFLSPIAIAELCRFVTLRYSYGSHRAVT